DSIQWPKATLQTTLVEAAPLAIYALDTAGLVRLWNRAAERIYGWREDEVLGVPDPTIPGAIAHEQLLREVVRGGRVVEREVIRKRRDGVLVEVAISAARLVNAQDEPSGMMVIAADISGRRKREFENSLVLERERIAR